MRQHGETTTLHRREVLLPSGGRLLQGEVHLAPGAPGIVLFAHGSGSSRRSPRNQMVARTIRQSGLGTLLFDMLTPEEQSADAITREYRFDIELLAGRLADAIRWAARDAGTAGLRMGLFGSSTGAAAALIAAAEPGAGVGAVVSRGGRPDLAARALDEVACPTLLIVGELDDEVIRLNEAALERLRCPKELRLVPGATHLFEEPGALEEVARLAAGWFGRHLGGSAASR